jgi:hypothetical protein
MSRRRPQRSGLPNQYTVVFVCTGLGSHPRRVLNLWTVQLAPDGAVVPRAWLATEETFPIKSAQAFAIALPVNCTTCIARRDYPWKRARELAREAIGDGSRHTVDVDICYRS